MKHIELNNGKVALIDDDDYDRVSALKWKEVGGYAAHGYKKNGKAHTVYMHRMITSAPLGMKVDHINHDALDNRKSNLRVCTHSQNHMNRVKLSGTSSLYKGVTWNKALRKWKAYISYQGKFRHIGYFDNEIHAAISYDLWSHDLFGQYALANFTRAG
jgi:hypothetical protein